MTNSGTKEIVEGDYVQTLPEASNDWHYVKITAQPGSDKVLSIFNTHLHLISISIFFFLSGKGVPLEEQGRGGVGIGSHRREGDRKWSSDAGVQGGPVFEIISQKVDRHFRFELS